VKVVWAIGTDNTFAYHSDSINNRGSAIIDLFDDDVCGHTQGCTNCLSHSNCVFCAEDGLCYDKSNVGQCTPLNTTCSKNLIPCEPALPNANLPDGFCASVWIRGLSTPRGMVVAANGDILVVEAGKQQVTVFWEDADGVQSNLLATAPGLNHAVAINDRYLYASNPTTVFRWQYQAGMRNPLTNRETVITNIPCCGHPTRSIVFDSQGYLYVQVGSASNVDPDTTHARINRFDVTNLPDGGLNWNSGQVFAAGFRNEVGLVMDNKDRLWGVENGVDNLNRPDLGGDIHLNNPSEEVNLIDPAGKFFGYPYCWTEYDIPVYGKGRGTQWVHPDFMGFYNDTWCQNPANVVVPAWNLGPHTAPLGIEFYYGTSFPAKYQGGAFVAEHGSWNRQPPSGYKIVYLTFDNGLPVAEEDFLKHSGAGAVWPNRVRPVNIAFSSCGTPAQDCMYVTSDASGEIILITLTP